MGINARRAVHPRFMTHVAPTLRGFAWTHFRIIEPNTISGNEGFDPWTNSTDTDPVVLWDGWGQMQVYRQTLAVETPAGGITQLRSLRFTVPHKDTVGLNETVIKGMQLVVLEVEPGADAEVVNYQYTVTSAIGAPLGWTRTIDAEVNTGVAI